MSEGTKPEYLLDVSRLVWRSWRGRPATGIDRVCLAYLNRFGGRSQLVVQRGGHVLVLSRRWSNRFRRLLLGDVSRITLLSVLIPALAAAHRAPPRRDMTYLNVGHTGLDEPTLPRWIARHRVRAVYLVHDIIPLTHPEYCRSGEAAKHERRMTNALGSAAGLIVNSEVTGQELARFALNRRVELPPCLTAWLGLDRVNRPDRREGSHHPYFISVGTIEGRKNHLLLLDLWAALVEDMGKDAPNLVIAGGRGWEAEETFARLDHLGPLKGTVREIAGCADDELARLVAGARALVMPSFVEGYGLPVMEALAVGTPVIASDLPVYREVVGDIPTYLAPDDMTAWEAAVRSYAVDGPERADQLRRMASFEAPSWQEHFHLVEHWLKTIEA